METLISVLIFLTFTSLLVLKVNKSSRHQKRPNLLNRFKKKFRNKSHLRERLSEEFQNSLLADPESNITIGSWYSEEELREKADIHRARLSKFGRSKMNGEMLFLGPKGGVYKLTIEGKKKYV